MLNLDFVKYVHKIFSLIAKIKEILYNRGENQWNQNIH